MYVYLDPRKMGTFIYGDYCFGFEPFYVGKGYHNRMYDHLKDSCNSNTKKLNIISELKKEGLVPVIFRVKKFLTENESLQEEHLLVDLIGRLNKNTGPLTNMRPGGGHNLSGEYNPMYGRNDQCMKKGGLIDFVLNSKGKTYEDIYGEEKAKEKKIKLGNLARGRVQTEEDRKKKSISNKKAWENNEMLHKIASENGKKSKGRKKTPEQRKYQSERQKGRIPWNKGIPVKDETKNKISNTALENLIKRLNIDTIMSLYENGMSISNIAKELKSSKHTISKMLKNPNKYRSYNKETYD